MVYQVSPSHTLYIPYTAVISFAINKLTPNNKQWYQNSCNIIQQNYSIFLQPTYAFHDYFPISFSFLGLHLELKYQEFPAVGDSDI